MEQKYAAQRNLLEELRNQLAQQEKLTHEQQNAAKAMETELSLLRLEMERIE